MLQDLLSDQNKQAVEHELEIQGLLQSMNTREQASQVSAAVKPDKGPVILMSADRKCWGWRPGLTLYSQLGFFPSVYELQLFISQNERVRTLHLEGGLHNAYIHYFHFLNLLIALEKGEWNSEVLSKLSRLE